MKKKKVSKRRWKARAKLGLSVPRWAIVEHKLYAWARWVLIDEYKYLYQMKV